jgi:hypothetical protein
MIWPSGAFFAPLGTAAWHKTHQHDSWISLECKSIQFHVLASEIWTWMPKLSCDRSCVAPVHSVSHGCQKKLKVDTSAMWQAETALLRVRHARAYSSPPALGLLTLHEVILFANFPTLNEQKVAWARARNNQLVTMLRTPVKVHDWSW